MTRQQVVACRAASRRARLRAEGLASDAVARYERAREIVAKRREFRHAGHSHIALPLEGIRVLIVEDNDDLREVLAISLSHDGATVVAVVTAGDALPRLAEVDIVVTDLAMPGNDGLWLLEQMSDLDRPYPVILLSGYDARQISGLEDAPFTRVLLKPVLPPELTRVIREVLGMDRPV